MNNRTMVKLTAYQYGIGFQTVSRSNGSQYFYIRRSDLAELAHKEELTVCDGDSFATLRQDKLLRTVTIRFVWLTCGNKHLTGYEETVSLPYAELADFAQASLMAGGPKHRRILSIEWTQLPCFVFCDTQRLHECLQSKTVRRKLVRFLRDHFHWEGYDKVCFYDAAAPYSFIYQVLSRRHGATGGALLLLGEEDAETAHYIDYSRNNYEEM